MTAFTADDHLGSWTGDPAVLLEAFAELVETVRRPAWHSFAACRDHPEVNFFPARGEKVTTAREVCDGCLVRQACADAGMGERHGIWGGLSERQRRQRRRRAATPDREAEGR